MNSTVFEKIKKLEPNNDSKDGMSRVSMGRDVSNEDIKVVYEDKSGTAVRAKKTKGMTSTDFQKAMHSTGTVIMVDPG